MKKYLLWILLGALGSGCKRPAVPLSANQGTVIYDVSYPDSARYGLKAAFFPRQIRLVYSDSKATFLASGGMGMVQFVDIMDKDHRSAVSLLIDQLRENFGCRLTEDEIKINERGAPCKVEYTGDTATIAGRPARGIRLRNASGQLLFSGYCDARIPLPYWNSPFEGMDRLLLQYDHSVNGLTMHLTAASVDTATAVDTAMFTVKGKYQWVNQQQFFTRLSGL